MFLSKSEAHPTIFPNLQLDVWNQEAKKSKILHPNNSDNFNFIWFSFLKNKLYPIHKHKIDSLVGHYQHWEIAGGSLLFAQNNQKVNRNTYQLEAQQLLFHPLRQSSLISLVSGRRPKN